MNEVVGFDTAIVEAWIVANVEGLHAPFSWRQLAGGHSNLTFAMADASGRQVVVRRPPPGKLLTGAHDMGREYRIVSALWPEGVPVAPPLACCTDTSVAGVVFSVMGFVEGRTLENATDSAAWLDEGARQVLSDSYVDALVALHAVDPTRVGLDALARADGYVARQLKAWHRSWTTNAADAGDDPRIHELRDLLEAHQPAEAPARVVHGDCGLNNCLVGRDGRLNALVDWEVATLGQPIADLAFAANRWSTPDDPIEGREGAASELPGFRHRRDLVARYAQRSGRDISDLPYYELLNHWRSACIAHGVYARYVRGQRDHDGVDIDRFRRAVDARLKQAVAAARAAGLR